MEYVIFGNTGMMVSRFCLGTMMFSRKLDLEGSRRVVDEAIDHGVNFIDTADSYGDSEDLLGRILSAGKRERVYLATKVYRQHSRDKRVARNSRVNIINQLEQSLRLMRTDYVDLYQLHHPDDQTPIDETLDTLNTLVSQGKIRYWGVSNHYAWQAGYMLGTCHARRLNPPVSLQADYSLVNPQIERESVPLCRRVNLALMAYSPLGGGVLTGKYHDGDGRVTVPENVRFENERWHEMLRDRDGVDVVKTCRRVAEENNLEMSQAAILWLKSKPWVTTVILGGSRPEHYTRIYDVADAGLPAEAVRELDEVSARRQYSPFKNQPVQGGFRLPGQVP